MEDIKPSTFNFELLDVDNYSTWSTRMRFYLMAKDLWSAVTTTPAPTDATGKKKDEKALAVIVLAVKAHHFPTVADCENAKSAWDALERIYKASSAARQLQLKRQISALKKDANEPLTKYIARARDIYAQLKAAGDSIKETELVAPVG